MIFCDSGLLPISLHLLVSHFECVRFKADYITKHQLISTSDLISVIKSVNINMSYNISLITLSDFFSVLFICITKAKSNAFTDKLQTSFSGGRLIITIEKEIKKHAKTKPPEKLEDRDCKRKKR